MATNNINPLVFPPEIPSFDESKHPAGRLVSECEPRRIRVVNDSSYCTSRPILGRIAAIIENFTFDMFRGTRFEVKVTLKDYFENVKRDFSEFKSRGFENNSAWFITDLIASEFIRCLAVIVIMPIKYAFAGIGGLLGGIYGERQGKKDGQQIGLILGEWLWTGIDELGGLIKFIVYTSIKEIFWRIGAILKHCIVDPFLGGYEEYTKFKQHFKKLSQEWNDDGESKWKRFDICISEPFRIVVACVVLPIKYAFKIVGGTLGALVYAFKGKDFVSQLIDDRTSDLIDGFSAIGRQFGSRTVALAQHIVDDMPEIVRYDRERAQEYLKTYHANQMKDSCIANVGNKVVLITQGLTTGVVMPLKYLLTAITGIIGALVLHRPGKNWGQLIGLAAGELLWMFLMELGNTINIPRRLYRCLT